MSCVYIFEERSVTRVVASFYSQARNPPALDRHICVVVGVTGEGNE